MTSCEKLGAQVWMTGADAAAFAEIAGKADMFEVSPGQIGQATVRFVDARCLLRDERSGPRGAARRRGGDAASRAAARCGCGSRTSGVNPSDVKSRAGLTRKIAFPRVIPHSDGAGEIDRVGEGVPAARVGERVWVWNGQWRRAFGTAAEWIVLPAEQAVRAAGQRQPWRPAPASAFRPIPPIRRVRLAGAEEGSTVLVAAGAGAVGHYAIQFAKKTQGRPSSPP